MDDNDFPRFAGDAYGFDLSELVGLRDGLRGGGIGELMRAGRREKLIPQSLGIRGSVLDVMAPENSGWLYDGTQPPETFGI